eukprot:126958_1
MAIRLRSSSNRTNTVTDISDILHTNQEPHSMMLSAKLSISNDKNKKNSSDIIIDGHCNNDNNLEMENNHRFHNINSENNDYNLNSKYYPSNNNNSYFEPFVGGTPQLGSSGGLASKNEECMRKILQLTFIICIICFISPLIFFIAGASQIIQEYARIAPAVRKHDDNNDTNVHNFWHYPTIGAICEDGKHYCIRYIYFFIYVIIFTIMFVSCISLFAIRKDKHPLKSRSCVFISIFCVALPFYMIWACIGLLYAPSW